MKETDGWVKIKKYTDDDGKPVCSECICQLLGGCKFQPPNEWGPGPSCPVWHGESKSGWQPIETAPKIGVAQVYLEAELFGSRVHTATFHPNVTTISGRFDFDCPKMTHWMPLPSPPQENNHER